MNTRATRTAALITVAACLSYMRFARPYILNFGATAEEITRSMPGDDILPDASLQTTRAITIGAAPADIWPWIVQMGPHPRGGAYTYDWIERLFGIDIENSDHILPQFQHLEPNQFLGLNDKGQGLRVREVNPEHALVLQWIPAKSTWTFGLYPAGEGRTRLVSRNRIPGSGPLFWAGMLLVMEAGSLVMERKMLTGIKARAERTGTSNGLALDRANPPSGPAITSQSEVSRGG